MHHLCKVDLTGKKDERIACLPALMIWTVILSINM